MNGPCPFSLNFIANNCPLCYTLYILDYLSKCSFVLVVHTLKFNILPIHYTNPQPNSNSLKCVLYDAS